MAADPSRLAEAGAEDMDMTASDGQQTLRKEGGRKSHLLKECTCTCTWHLLPVIAAAHKKVRDSETPNRRTNHRTVLYCRGLL